MNTESTNPFSIVYYDYVFTLTKSIRYQIVWKCDDIKFYTCGDIKEKIHALKFLKETAIVNIFEPNGGKTSMSIEHFTDKYPSERFNLKYNCHGWTFTYGHFLLMDHYIPPILNREYHEVSKYENHDIVVFKCLDQGTWIHSCKKTGSGYTHKDWIKDFYFVKDPIEILKMPQYANTELHYFKRNKVNCDLVCLISQHSKKVSLTV